MSCIVLKTFQILAKNWDTYSFFYGPHMYVCLQSWTYDGDHIPLYVAI
jgi:hypothetical protein